MSSDLSPTSPGDPVQFAARHVSELQELVPKCHNFLSAWSTLHPNCGSPSGSPLRRETPLRSLPAWRVVMVEGSAPVGRLGLLGGDLPVLLVCELLE